MAQSAIQHTQTPPEGLEWRIVDSWDTPQPFTVVPFDELMQEVTGLQEYGAQFEALWQEEKTGLITRPFNEPAYFGTEKQAKEVMAPTPTGYVLVIKRAAETRNKDFTVCRRPFLAEVRDHTAVK